jgi:hypothetical protein
MPCVLVEEPFEDRPKVLEQMEAIHDLLRGRRALGDGACEGTIPIAATEAELGRLPKPICDPRTLAIG